MVLQEIFRRNSDMPEKIAPPPGLYSPSADGITKLNGGCCRRCGYVFFPPQSYGCEVCGSGTDQLEPKALKGEGVLSSFATVHLHQGKGIEAPFTVGVILLDEGPAIRTILAQRTDAGLKIGDRMRAITVPAGRDESGASVDELRFAKHEPAR
jgi:uncharacterized OB-fold protein